MSLEAALQENTTAIRELIAALSAGAVITKAKQAEPKKAPVAKAQPAPEPVTKEQPVSEPVPVEQPVTEEPEQLELEVSYDDVSKAVVALHRAKGRQAAVEVLEKFGLPTAREAKPEQWAPIIEACKEALGE